MPTETPTCFHHTDRPTGRRCTRCGRPACPDCLEDAAVGSHCWECRRAARPSPREQVRRRVAGEPLLVTKILVAANVVAYLALVLAGSSGPADPLGAQGDWALFAPAIDAGEWWRIVTSGFVHFNLLHIGFNMFILYQVGMILERVAGHARFAVIYAVSLVAGSFLALYLDPLAHTGGASGAVFGVAAAATLLMWRRGVPFWRTGFGPLLVINFVLTFTLPSVSIGGHLGGTIGGLLAGWALLEPAPRPRPAPQGYAIAAAIAVIAVIGSLWSAAHWPQLA